MRHLNYSPILTVILAVFISGCDKRAQTGESKLSEPKAAPAPTKPQSDPVAELKAILAKADSAPVPSDDPSGYLKDVRLWDTKLDVSKTDSLTAPYRATLKVNAFMNWDDPRPFKYLATLDYGDSGWNWDGNLRIWEQYGDEMSQKFISGASGRCVASRVHDMFVLHFRLPTE